MRVLGETLAKKSGQGAIVDNRPAPRLPNYTRQFEKAMALKRPAKARPARRQRGRRFMTSAIRISSISPCVFNPVMIFN
jgi:hypothetical protein